MVMVTRQEQDLSQIKAMWSSFALLQIPLCLTQARLKVGRSKTAAKALERLLYRSPIASTGIYSVCCIYYAYFLQDHGTHALPSYVTVRTLLCTVFGLNELNLSHKFR